MYEWLPWVDGRLDEVPDGEAARRAYTDKRVKSRKISSEMRSALEKWYGSKAKDVKFAEAFEVAEYGFQPTEDDIRRFFPMLVK